MKVRFEAGVEVVVEVEILLKLVRSGRSGFREVSDLTQTFLLSCLWTTPYKTSTRRFESYLASLMSSH